MKFYYQHYHKYKKIEIPWINEIPDHWKMLKLRNILERVNQKNQPDLPLLSVVRDKGVIKRELSKNDDNHNVIPEDLSNHIVVKIGQFAMNKMKAWQGSYGVSKYEGVVSPAYFIFDVKNVEKDFFHMAIRSKAYIPFFNQSSEGVRVDQWDLSIERMKNVPFFIPPLEEQNAIVHFLDYTDRRIKRYIRAKQKLIKLLEEEKQAIIHQAVTCGLNPDVPMKPSGVDWLGEIPEHWFVMPLKRIVMNTYGSIKPGPFGSQLTSADMNGGDIKVYTQRNVIDKDLDKGEQYISFEKFKSLQSFQVYPGDILVTSRGTIGSTVLVTNSSEHGILHPCLIKVTPDIKKINPYYLMVLIQDSQLLKKQLLFLSNATTIDVIYSGTLANIKLPIPSIKEQNKILNFIEIKTNKINSLINQNTELLNYMKEYRTRLIADVVTGKLDVREAASQLPEELLAEEIDIEETEVEDEEEQQEALEP